MALGFPEIRFNLGRFQELGPGHGMVAWHGSGELEDCKAECKELRQFAAEKAGKRKMMAM